MFDKIEKYKNSTIHHGENNKRLYLMKLDKSDYPDIILELKEFAEERDYEKIFAKVPEWSAEEFEKAGYEKEAYIPKFYDGETDALFFSKFLKKERAELSEEERTKIEDIVKLAKLKSDNLKNLELKEGYSLKVLEPEDAENLSELYKVVFETYPFPIHDPDYIKKTMAEHIIYFGVFKDGRIVSASSAECDQKALNSEMTDFATHPDYLGNGFAVNLLELMEKEIKKQNYQLAYTIARSFSPGMNITFAKMGYKFTGTLVNNTNISGEIESMNVWYKII